jgi:adenylate cyclase
MKSLSIHATAAIFAAVLTLLVGVALSQPFGTGLEDWMSDKMQTWRYELVRKFEPNRKPDPRLILASVDQRSVDDLGRWPFPRTTDAEFLGVLAAAKPKVVGWDVLFTEVTAASASQDAPPPPAGTEPALQPDDEEMVKGAQLTPNLVLAAEVTDDGSSLHGKNLLPTRPLTNIRGDVRRIFSSPRAIIPFKELCAVSYFGFVNAPENDQRRYMPLVVSTDGKVFASLSLQILMLFWDVHPDQVVVDLGHEITFPKPDGTSAHIPIDDAGRLLVNYRGRTGDFKSMGFSSMGAGLADQAANRSSPERSNLPPLKDNIVMVGVTLSGVDEGTLPIELYSPQVTAHLNVLNNILQEDYLHTFSPWFWLPVYFIFLFVVANAMLRVGISPMIPIGLGAVAVGGIAAFSALWFANLLIPILIPEVGVLILSGAVPTKRFFGEEREKRRIRGAMGAYLSEKVMAKVLEHPDNLKLGGVKQEITIMFCDIRGFTAYCDNRDPQETMDVLNDYMEVMTQVVFKHEGTIDKYIGDCIMAFWNAPELQPDHAQRAVLCAMEMRQALAAFKAKHTGPGTEKFECGIGIHTGEALVGNMGSSLKRNYTAMGSSVNLAARLESITKKLGERIVISQDTLNQLYGDLHIIDKGEVEVSGFALPVHLYAVITESAATDTVEPEPAPGAAASDAPEGIESIIYETIPLPEPSETGDAASSGVTPEA